ncbi:MAG: PAS domain S-box protein [Rhodanobacter sp.]|nr:MAG: PAS domain S-box protein [Rhodanobacter sp.]
MMRAAGWTSPALGAPADWTPPLRAVVELLLNSKFPMFVAWGENLGFVYNDAYAPILGNRHPDALGKPFREIWPEIWPDISPLIDSAMKGDASYHENLPLLMKRKGFEEPTWFTFSYSPVRDENGAVAGMFCACTETTEQMLGARRQRFRLALEERLSGLADAQEIMHSAAELLGQELAADRAGYAEVMPEGEVFTVTQDWSLDIMPSLAGRYRLDAFGTALIAELRAGRAVTIDDTLADDHTGESTAEAYDKVRVRAIIAAPLVKDGRLVAVFYVHQSTPRRWREEEKMLVLEGADRTWSDVERARAQAALREGEDRLQLAFAAASAVGTWDWDISANRVYADARFARFYAVDPKEAERGIPLAGFVQGIHPDDREGVEQAIQQAIATRQEYQCEYRVRDSAGVERWLLARGRVFYDAAGLPLRFPGVTVDITETKRIQSALRDSEERLSRSLDAAEMGVWELNVATQQAWRSAQHDRIFGYNEMLAEWTYQKFLDHVFPADRPAVDQQFTKAIETRGAWDFECRILRADGVARWVWGHGKVETDAHNNPLRIKGMVRDIDQRKRLEEDLHRLNDTLENQVAERTAKLQASEATLRAIFETSHQYQGFLTPEGILLDTNTASLAGIRGTLADVVGKPFWETPWFTGTPGMPESIREAIPKIAAGETIRHEIHLNLPEGGWRWFDFAMRPIRDSHGEIFALVPEAMETTQRRKAEEALLQSQKLEAMGQLTGGVAHDFNNLLTPIIGTLDLLRGRDWGTEREQRLICGALQSADRAKALVQRLLAFARRQPLKPIPVNFAELIAGMSELLSSTLGPQISIVLSVDENLPPVRADPHQLEMAMLNLAVNARDAMPDGGILRISAVHESHGQANDLDLEPGDFLLLSLADTGFGMDKSTLARAVEPFYSTKGVGKGTGLGLSMAHGLAAQLGGALTIASTPGVGTEVKIRLPVSTKRAPAVADPAQRGIAADLQGTILLVDDEELVRYNTAAMLVEAGFDVVEVAGAEEALGLLSSGLQIDALLSDYLMPGMTGSDLAQIVAARWPGIPVLIASGYTEAEMLAPGLHLLVKPFRHAELLMALRTVMARD